MYLASDLHSADPLVLTGEVDSLGRGTSPEVDNVPRELLKNGGEEAAKVKGSRKAKNGSMNGRSQWLYLFQRKETRNSARSYG